MARKVVKGPSTITGLRLSNRILDRLTAFCDITKAPRSSVVEAALEKYLTDEKFRKMRELDL